MKIKRVELVKEICILFNLPGSKKSKGYFTKRQLIDLMFYAKEHERRKVVTNGKE